MKRLMAIILFLIPLTVMAQRRVTVTGYQERIPNANAELRCDGVRITRTMEIDSISGYHNGFWITKSGRIEKAYWTLRQAVTFTLPQLASCRKSMAVRVPGSVSPEMPGSLPPWQPIAT